ncbi:MAG: hypothetical protein HC781_22970 [Leptolyngbyaceae cyanobacterium CSU_1_4]|nr:hypothetical protein [Leptolyngbyaceae cyanobacterium CSU_1_4]
MKKQTAKREEGRSDLNLEALKQQLSDLAEPIAQAPPQPNNSIPVNSIISEDVASQIHEGGIFSEEIKIQPRQASSAERCDRSFQPLPEWRRSRKRADYDPDYLNYLLSVYLPVIPCNRDRIGQLGIQDAQAWLSRADFDEERMQLAQIQWSAYQSSLNAQKVKEQQSEGVRFYSQDEIPYQATKVFWDDYNRIIGWEMPSEVAA